MCFISQNIFAMDLRSSHKEKPSPRLRFSLTRAMSTDIDQGERAGMFRRPLWRKNRQRASKRGAERPCHRPVCPLRKEKSVEEDWATSEEEKQQTKKSEDILYGQSAPPIFSDTFDLSGGAFCARELVSFPLQRVSRNAALQPSRSNRRRRVTRKARRHGPTIEDEGGHRRSRVTNQRTTPSPLRSDRETLQQRGRGHAGSCRARAVQRRRLSTLAFARARPSRS